MKAMPYYIVVLGVAGSGKTTLTGSLQGWLEDFGFDVATINLDPAAEYLPYTPDVDVRDYVDARDVMRKYKLGPNGALIASSDLIVTKLDELLDEVNSLRSNYIIIDTPGQLEVFAFRDAGPIILNSIIGDHKSLSLFLIDAIFSKSPSNMLSTLLLSTSIQLRLGKPQVNVLTKTDLLAGEEIDKILDMIENPEVFISILARDKSTRLLWDYSDLEAIIPRVITSTIIPVSSITREGFDNLYAMIQRVVAGGEDYYTEEPSPLL